MSLFMPSEEVKRDERIKILEEKLNALSEENETLNQRGIALQTQVNDLTGELSQAKDEQEKAIANVKRKQNEADLLFVSMKIIFELMNGKEYADVQYLLDQQMALQRQMQTQVIYPPQNVLQAIQNIAGGIR